MQQIKDNIASGLSCYILNKENPTASASRDLNVAQVNSIDGWFQVSPILWQDMNYLSSGDLPNDDPELKKDITSHSTLLSEDVLASAEHRI